MKYTTWLRPGMMVKRWIAVLFIGIVFTSLSTAMALAWFYRNYDFPDRLSNFVQFFTLQFIPHPYREILVFAPGLILIIVGILRLSNSLTAPLLENRTGEGGLAKIIESHRFRSADAGLRVVTIGGGTGLSTLLRGLKHHPVQITAIVTAGDDGGSSGRLRSEFNMPAPGDIRNCLVALADSETLLGDLFQYRFEAHESGLNGHSFGNLFITALTKVSGSFERAIIESGRVLNIRGSVVPASSENIIVGAEMEDGSTLRGETTIVDAQQHIKRVFIEPENAEAYDPAVAAIMAADLVVLGPGSLYTSVIPNLLVEGIAHALRYTSADTVYVCNVATQPGETDSYSVLDHVQGIADHLHGAVPIDQVLVNSNLTPSRTGIRPEWGVSAVRYQGLGDFESSMNVVRTDVVNPEFPLRHDPDKLAAVLVELARESSNRPELPTRLEPQLALKRARGAATVSGGAGTPGTTVKGSVHGKRG